MIKAVEVTINKSSPASPSSSVYQGVKMVEFPTIVISDNDQKSPFNRLDSLNLNSVHHADSESFPKNNNYQSNNQVMNSARAQTSHHPTYSHGFDELKLETTIPKLASFLTMKQDQKYQPKRPQSAPKYLVPTRTGQTNPLEPPVPSTRPMALNQRTLHSGKGKPQQVSETQNAHYVTSNDAPNTTGGKSIKTPMIDVQITSSRSQSNRDIGKPIDNSVINSVPNSGRPYTDPLTQEQRYISPDKDKYNPNSPSNDIKSLKDLLVDALEDFYLNNDHIKHERDIATLKKVGLGNHDIKAIHDSVIRKKQPIASVIPTSQPASNLVTMQVITSPRNQVTNTNKVRVLYAYYICLSNY